MENLIPNTDTTSTPISSDLKFRGLRILL